MIGGTINTYRGRRWIVSETDAILVERLSNDLRVPQVLARLLVARGLGGGAEATAFLDPKFRDLHSPFLLNDMDAAANRIVDAIRKSQKITIYGDYDVDGITGTAMLWHTLKAAVGGGANIATYIPHRVDEGYGLNEDAVRAIAADGTKLLVTIDCGCSAARAVAAAREAGMDVVVTDHHEFGDTRPAANALVHPRADPDNSYPNPDLCGAGVAFKLCWAVAQKLCNAQRVNDVYRGLLMEFAALAALGTIADVVPLVGENRILVKHGLTQLARTTLPGLQALIEAAGYGVEAGRELDTVAVGFGLAPRLNAAGRMGHAREAVELLTTAQGERATEIAEYLEAQNRSRQSTERKMVETAKERILADANGVPSVIVVEDESFHVGVVGIVASRLVDLYYRPTFVLSRSGGELHGSARSVEGFALHEAIEHARDLLISGGGHAMAGGIKLMADNIEKFRQRMAAFCGQKLTDDMLVPSMKLDGILDLDDCIPEIIAGFEKLAPFGRGNPRPMFLVKNARLNAPPRRVGSTGSHMQLTIEQDCQRGRRAGRCICFKMGDLAPQLPVGTMLNLVVEPKVDRWNGREKVDLVVVDMARCNGEAFAVS